MKKIFKSFDKDNSGFIDTAELADVAKELGRPMDADELEECMKDLDINKDGKISYEEFSKWWLSGRQGLSSFMRRLLAFKLSTTKFFGNIQSSLQSVLEEAKNEVVDINTSHLSLNINKVQHAGTTFNIRLMLLSQESKQEYHRLRVLHNFGLSDEEKPWIISVAVDIKNGNATKVQDLLLATLMMDEKVESLGIPHSVVVEGNRLVVGLALKMIPHQFIPIEQDSLDTIQEQLKVNQNLEATLRLASSPKDFLSEESETGIIASLIKGISFDLRVNMWRKVADVLSKLQEDENLAALMPLLIGISPATLLKIKGEIDIEIDEAMQEKIYANPMIEPFMMNAATLISSITTISDDDEYLQHLNDKRIPAHIIELIMLLNENLGDEIQYSLSQGQIAVNGRIAGDGLGKIGRAHV